MSKGSKNKKRIAVLAPRYGVVERGVEVFTKDLLKELGDEFELVVFSRRKTGKETRKVWAIEEENRLVQWIYWIHPRLKKMLDRFFLDPMSLEMLSFSLGVFPKLLFRNWDIIFPQNGVWGAMTCRVVRFLRGTPFIYRSAGGKEPMIIRQTPDVYVATTPEIEQFIRVFDPKLRVELIANGVDFEFFSYKTQPAKLKLEKPVFLCAGALIPSKRIDWAIRGVAELGKGSLAVLGEGPEYERIRKLGFSLLGKGRFLIKKVKHEEILSYYKACDVFTLPSKDEPFGIVYLEAMAMNLPVVAPDDESRRFIVGEAGILFESENFLEYVKALGRAFKRDFGNLPREQAERFDWKVIGESYRKVFRSLSSLKISGLR